MRKFELWLANMNSSNGHFVKKIRPVVIIQTDLLNGIHESTIVCPLTTKTIDGVELLRVQVDSSQVDHKSDILVDQIIALDNRKFIKKLGKLTAKQIERLTYSLKVVLDL
jgi:mRNA interferase MazF